MRWRFIIIFLNIIFFYCILIFNFYHLQVERGQYFAAQAESQLNSAGILGAQRGNIYFTDKNHNLIPAAINKEYPVVFSVPAEIKNIDEAAKIISKILGLDIEKIKYLFSKKNDLYELLAIKISPEQVEEIQKAGLAGIYIENRNLRFYPFEFLAAHLLGFIGPSDKDDGIKGRYGIEAFYNNLLGGEPGKIEGEKIIEPIHGQNLILTIDRNIQAQAEEALSNLIEKYEAKGGVVIVEDPQTGKILALGSSPSFNPNNYADFPLKNFLNPAVEAIYEPGSIFKVITMAAGIDSGKITPDTKYYDSGSVTLNGETIENWDKKAYGTTDMRKVIERSINTGAVFAQRKIGEDIFYNYLLKFGFKNLIGISLPGEVRGSLTSLEKDTRAINFATAAFGQGISVTPIELISAIAVIANGGILMKPFIIDGTESQVMHRVISQETARQVTEMMVSAVDNNYIAAIPNYKIAGKTGTAQIPDFVRGGYTDDVIDTFVGFAPATNARFVILIRMDNPKGAPLAGFTVVPAFRELANFILNYYNIPPDRIEK